MARKAYIGVNGKARRVTKMYIGAKMLTNLLPAGDFEGSGWSGATYSTAHAYSGTRSMQCVGTAGSAEDTHNTTANIALNNTHQYYASIYGWQDTKTNGARVGFYWPVAEPSFNDNLPIGEAGRWNRYSAINNRSSFSNGSYPFRVDWNNNGVAGTIYFDGCMLIDLTAEFGAGNEPTKEWCDDHIRFTAGGQVCAFVDGNSKARNIKKAYIGIGGKARPFWSYESIEYYGSAPPMMGGRCNLAAGSVGNCAIFAGGSSGNQSEIFGLIDCYNSELVYIAISTLSNAAAFNAAATVGGQFGHLAFTGGRDTGFNVNQIIDLYDSNLTKSTILDYTRRAYHSGTNIGDEFAIFGGGVAWNQVANDYAAYLDRDLAYHALGYTTQGVCNAAECTENYGVFAGGYQGMNASYGSRNIVDAYNSNLVRTRPATLSEARGDLSAAGTLNHVMFAGGAYGWGANNSKNLVECYDNDLTKSILENLIPGRTKASGASIGGYALFAGGEYYGGGSVIRNEIDVYSEDLVREKSLLLSTSRAALASAIAGEEFLLFAGGRDSGTSTYNSVEVVKFMQ